MDLRQQAVLMRTSHDSALLELELSRRQIPFVKYGGLRYLEAAHVKDLIALFRLAITRPTRSRGSACSSCSTASARRPPGAPRRARDCGRRRARRVAGHARTSPPTPARSPTPSSRPCAMPAVRQRPGHGPSFSAESLAPLDQGEVSGRRAAAARPRPVGRRRARSIGAGPLRPELVIDPPASSADLAGPPHLDEDYLVLSTIHSAKGLEWHAVHVLALYDGNFPACMAAGSTETIDEERRLLYVAMTRARRQLHLYVPVRYYHRPHGTDDAHGYGKPSRFLTADVQRCCTVIRPPDGVHSIEPRASRRRIEVSIDSLFE